MENVMKNAWEIAYEGVEKFGGKVKEYFAEALKIAWSLFKKGGSKVEEKTHNDFIVKHNNGNSDIEITVRHILKGPYTSQTSSSMYMDENRIVDRNEIKITGVKLNGNEVFRNANSKATLMDHPQHGWMIRLYNVEIGEKKLDQALVKINQQVNDEIHAPYYDRKKELDNKKVVVHFESSYDKQLCPICHSVCYGDCQAN